MNDSHTSCVVSAVYYSGTTTKSFRVMYCLKWSRHDV